MSNLGTSDQNGKCSPTADDKAKIGAKIHQFENGERERIEREEKERKRAMFERKLSKFSNGSEEVSHPPLVKKLSHVDKMAKKFSYERKSEEEEREIRRRREEFERKRSGFMSDTEDSSRKTSAEEDENTEESRNRLSKMRLMFEDPEAALAAAEAEKDRKRREEEEAETRRKEFQAKSSIFKKMSQTSGDDASLQLHDRT